MINSFKKKSFKWSIMGIIIVLVIGLTCLVNPKVNLNASKDSSNLNTNKATPEIQQNINSADDKKNNNSTEIISDKDYLSELNFALPKNWSIDKSQKFEYGIIDEKGESIGLIDPFDYVDNFDLLMLKPNHSSVIKDEYIDIPLGKCRLLTLDSDNGTAASGITGTHDAYFAEIPVKGKAIYILSFTKNDKKPETKAQFIQILKGLSVKN